MHNFNLKIRRMVYLGIGIVVMMVALSLIGNVTTAINTQNEVSQEVSYD